MLQKYRNDQTVGFHGNTDELPAGTMRNPYGRATRSDKQIGTILLKPMKRALSLLAGFSLLAAAVPAFAQSPGNINRGNVFIFHFEEVHETIAEKGQIQVGDEVAYLVDSRENVGRERNGTALTPGPASFEYVKIQPDGAELSYVFLDPPENGNGGNNDNGEPFASAVESYQLIFNTPPFNGTFTAEIELSDGTTGAASGTFDFVRGPWRDAVYAENGWLFTIWFGWAYNEAFPWVYQADQGWIFTESVNPDFVWFFHPTLGWMWTNADTYPFIVGQQDGEWVWYMVQQDPNNASGTAVYYNFATGEYETHPK